MLDHISKPLILASSSPRRLELLSQINVKPNLILAADIDESPLKNELPKDYCIRIAKEKALAVAKLAAQKHQDLKSAIILSGDTAVAMGRRILPKAHNAQEVEKCLKLLSGRRHRVYSCVCVLDEKGNLKSKIAISIVKFKKLEESEIALYLKSGEGVGKAGGYAIQGLAAQFIKFISGSYSAIVGLPIYETRLLLQNANH